MDEIQSLNQTLLLGAVVFGIGLVGVLARRNLIVMFLCVELMLQGVSLSLVGWGALHRDWGGQMLVVMIITTAACEAGIGLVLILLLCKQSGTLDVAFWQHVREDGTRPFVDDEIPEDPQTHEVWPTLTKAGVQPEVNPQDQLYRSRV
ncbi:MAG: NADH-quinone oxidoreductase subunit NuoK [Pirellulales bacterium]